MSRQLVPEVRRILGGLRTAYFHRAPSPGDRLGLAPEVGQCHRADGMQRGVLGRFAQGGVGRGHGPLGVLARACDVAGQRAPLGEAIRPRRFIAVERRGRQAVEKRQLLGVEHPGEVVVVREDGDELRRVGPFLRTDHGGLRGREVALLQRGQHLNLYKCKAARIELRHPIDQRPRFLGPTQPQKKLRDVAQVARRSRIQPNRVARVNERVVPAIEQDVHL